MTTGWPTPFSKEHCPGDPRDVTAAWRSLVICRRDANKFALSMPPLQSKLPNFLLYGHQSRVAARSHVRDDVWRGVRRALMWTQEGSPLWFSRRSISKKVAVNADGQDHPRRHAKPRASAGRPAAAASRSLSSSLWWTVSAVALIVVVFRFQRLT